MKLFGPLYDKMLAWSRHRLAARYLAAVSFAEASFFPLPTALLLAPMALAKRNRAWHFAALATVTSVLGGNAVGSGKNEASAKLTAAK